MTTGKMVLGVGLVALAGCVGPKQIGYDTMIAHRGESIDAPENTLPAYQLAVDRGFGFECDIYMSKDGQLFACHNSNLSQVTGGACSELCTEASWANTISKANVGGWGKWKGSKYDPTRPAKFEEVLALAREGRYIYVEIKGGNALWVAAIKETLKKQPKATPETVLFITFSESTVKHLREILPEYQTYLLLGSERSRTPEEVLARLKATGATGVDIGYNRKVHDAAFVKRIHDAGYSCHFWTIDNLTDTRAAFAIGGDSVTSNCPQKLLNEHNASK